MTDFYKTGKYWPEANKIVTTYKGRSLEVITINPDDSCGDESPAHAKDTYASYDDGIYDDDDYIFPLPVGEDGHADFIFDDGHEDSSSSSSSTMDEHPYDEAHVFTEELELLLTNVDGDSDPDEITIPPSAAGRRQCRRVYRKSMSLPMSPIGGARERLDSLNLSEFLLGSPLKMGGLIDHIDVDPVDHYEDLSMRNDFNLINFMGQDVSPVKVKEELQSPVNKVEVKEEPQSPAIKVKEEEISPEKQQVVVNKEFVEPAVVVKKPTAPLSKGKCLELLRATHERQENLVKRCVAIEHQKRTVSKNLFQSVSVPAAAVTRGRTVSKTPRRNITEESDPNWSPTRDMYTPTSKKNPKTVAVKKEKSSGSNPTTNSQSAGSAANKASLNEIKKRFNDILTNIPMGPKNAPQKTPLKVLRMDIPIVPIADHDYCSPVKRSQPIGRTIKNRTKATILIDEVPTKIKKEKTSPKKAVVQSVPQPKVSPLKEQKSPPVQVKVEDTPPVVVEKPRRKINLEDYKKLRNQGTIVAKVKNTVDSVELIVEKVETPHKPTVTFPKEYIDPISEAKNKALRLQEKRRAAKLKQDEIQLPITPLMPILPLAIMAGLTTEETAEDAPTAGFYKSIYFDEIMIVSVGCNTDVTILPSYESIVGNISQSSSFLLSNRSNRNKNPITSNSLLFSIQDVVIKKSVPQNFIIQKSPNSAISASSQCSPGKPEGANVGALNDHTGYHHGEDKVIMHLRKDRIRPKTTSISCQTDVTPEFPQLKLLAKKNKRHYRRRSTSASSTGSSSSYESDSRSEASRSSNNSEADSEDEYERNAKRRRLYSNSKSWSRSRSRDVRSRSPSGCTRRSRDRSTSRYRSRSPARSTRESRSRSRSKSENRRPVNRNNQNNANRWLNRNRSPVEERRIVYVGRLEKDLTKEGLRRKFNGYGKIKLVTLHEKSNGTRYGFVTFEEAADAFRAIETAKEDSIINMYDVSFGGRRAFCGASYADLDNVETEDDIYGMAPIAPANTAKQEEESFESLLQSFKKKVMAIGP